MTSPDKTNSLYIFNGNSLNAEEKMEFLFESIGREKKYYNTLQDFINKSPKYTNEKIATDLLRIKTTKEKFENPTKESIIFEQLLTGEIELSEWMGPYCHTFKTTEYDDLYNHTDFIVIIKYHGKNHYLAVDATVSDDKSEYEKKYKKIKQEIDRGKGTDIEYFMTNSGMPKQLKNIPSVVIGIQKQSLKEMGELMYDKIFAKGEYRKKAISELHQSSIQITMLKDFITQLRTIDEYIAEKNINTEVAKNIKSLIPVLESILANKKRSLTVHDRPGKTPIINSFSFDYHSLN